MPVLLPEKTVEVWTGIAVSHHLPFAEIWSPPNLAASVDQTIRAGKTWAFELKTAYEGNPSYIPVDLNQLKSHAFSAPHAVPVLYLLPAVPWLVVPPEPVSHFAGAWRTFPWWSWIVSARQLAYYCGVKESEAPAHSSRSLRVMDLPLPHPHGRGWLLGMWLAEFLARVGACTEPNGWTRRTEVPIEVTTRNVTADASADGYLLIHVPVEALPDLGP